MPGRRPERIKLIHNPLSGRAETSPALLQEVIAALQEQNYLPEVHLIGPATDLPAVIADALRRRITLFAVCGGDGTLENVARLLAGKRVTLALLPAGTQNNVALSLGIPADIRQAAALIRTGNRVRIDMGLARTATASLPFMEVCSIGLFSALFESADNLQKGDLASLGGIFSTLASFPLAHIDLRLSGDELVSANGHVALVANLPFFGLNYRVTPGAPFDDGVLDVLVFSDYSKLELVGNVLQTAGEQGDDPRLHRFQARSLEIRTDPPLPVQADGVSLGQTPVRISVHTRSLRMVTGLAGNNPSGGVPWGFLRNLKFLRFFQR